MSKVQKAKKVNKPNIKMSKSQKVKRTKSQKAKNVETQKGQHTKEQKLKKATPVLHEFSTASVDGNGKVLTKDRSRSDFRFVSQTF